MQALVDGLHIGERQRLEPVKEVICLLVAVLDEAEILARFRLHRLIRLVIEAHI